MSTKTTFKRVALVAVAALGLGVLSVAPSTAAINADTLTLSSATAAQNTAETATATSAVATVSFLGAQYDSVTVTASLVSAPAGATALPVLTLTETASALVDGKTLGTNRAAGYSIVPNSAAAVVAGDATKVTTAKFAVYLATGLASAGSAASVAAPTVVGTYVVKLTPAALGGNTLAASVAQTLTITVTAAAALDTKPSAATSTVRLTGAETVTPVTASTDDVVVATKVVAASPVPAATVKITQLNAASEAASESITAIVTGVGLINSGPEAITGSAGAEKLSALTSTKVRALTAKAGDLIQIWSDGASGVATVTFTSSTGVALGSKSVTFYGDATTVTAATTALTTGTVGVVGTTNKLITVTAKDAAGTSVITEKWYLVSANTAIISNSYTECNAWNATDGITCNVTGVAKGTTTVYVTNRASATATTPTTEVKSTPVSVRIGSSTVSTVSVALDKTTYAQGEKATLTVTVKDADGNVVPSGTYPDLFATGGIVASYTMGNGSDTTTATNALNSVDGVKTYTLYMPIMEGPVTFKYTTGTGVAAANQAKDVTVTATVSSSAIEAANAATTAALAANDAVDALAATVAKLVANLKAQITALTKLIVKIQKKVGA